MWVYLGENIGIDGDLQFWQEADRDPWLSPDSAPTWTVRDQPADNAILGDELPAQRFVAGDKLACNT